MVEKKTHRTHITSFESGASEGKMIVDTIHIQARYFAVPGDACNRMVQVALINATDRSAVGC